MIERETNLEALTKLQQKIEEVKELYAEEYIKDEELSLLVDSFIESKSPFKRSTERREHPVTRDLTPFYEPVKKSRAEGVKGPETRIQLGLKGYELGRIVRHLLETGQTKQMAKGPPNRTIEVSLQKEEGQKTKEAFKIVVERHLANNPNEILVLGNIGIEIGVSRERVRQIKVEYEAENKVKLPFKKRYKKVIPEKELDKKVKKMGNLSVKEIVNQLGVRFADVSQSRARINRAERKTLRNRIIRIRNQEGWGDTRIAGEIGLPLSLVRSTLNQLRAEKKVRRVRKVYRSEQEARDFEDKIEEMIKVQHLSNRKIAAITGDKLGTIVGYRGRLKDQGRL